MSKSKSAKIKTPAADYAIPSNREEADEFIYKIGEASRDRQLAETAMNEDIAKIKAEYEAKAGPAAVAISKLTWGLQTWCETHRKELLDGDSKTVKFGNGEVSWRARPPKVTLRGLDKILAWLDKHKLDRFVRIIREINKEAMLADAVEARKVPGVSIASAGEDFIVAPFESQLEAVQEAKSNARA
jgi:phage host-nuclease inhibitor protein Gam